MRSAVLFFPFFMRVLMNLPSSLSWCRGSGAASRGTILRRLGISASPRHCPHAAPGFCCLAPYLERLWRRFCTPTASRGPRTRDRKSTRLNSSHITISYAVFCLKKKKKTNKMNKSQKKKKKKKKKQKKAQKK